MFPYEDLTYHNAQLKYTYNDGKIIHYNGIYYRFSWINLYDGELTYRKPEFQIIWYDHFIGPAPQS